MQRQKGLTLIELVAVLAIASILLVIALPAFQTQVRNARLSAAATDLLSTFMHARAEASARRNPVIVCKRNADSTACLTGASDTWDLGWMTFVDANGDGTFDTDDGDEIIQIHAELHPELTAFGTDDLPSLIIYNPRGTTNLEQVGTQAIIICDEVRRFSDNSRHTRAVVLSLLGKASVMNVAESGFTVEESICNPS